MREVLIAPRAGPLIWGWLAAVLLVVLLPTASLAQVQPDTVPRDTARADTVRVPIPPEQVKSDTLPADSARRDSVAPPPVFPRFPQRVPRGWAFARWEWDRQELLRQGSLSLLHLLEQVPGLLATRSGDFGSPAGVSALGLGGGRVRVYVDGFELDPLGFTTPDLQYIGVMDLELVRVERDLGGIRVELTTVRLPDGRPYSTVMAGTGVYDAKLLRALFTRPAGRRSIVTAGYDLVSTRSVGFRTPFAASAGHVSWSYALGERTAVQAEYRTTGVQFTGGPLSVDADQRTLLLRGRSEIRPGLMLDAMLGRTSRTSGGSDPVGVPLASTQGAVRAGYDMGPAWLQGAVRFRTGSLSTVAAPALELSARGAWRPLAGLAAETEVRSAALGGAGGLEWSGTVRAAPAAGLAAFATLSTGARGLGLVRDTLVLAEDTAAAADSVPSPLFSAISTSTAGVRAGVEWVRDDATVGAALIGVAGGRVAPFGLAFDRGTSPLEVEAASGVESYLSLPIPRTRNFARLEGWYQFWMERGGRPYLPRDHGRAALVLHGLFYEGELEPTLRVEGVRRGGWLVPGAGGAGAETSAYHLVNLYLQIRIQEVRAFFLMENVLNVRTAVDLPELRLPGGRFIYGVHWTFRN